MDRWIDERTPEEGNADASSDNPSVMIHCTKQATRIDIKATCKPPYWRFWPKSANAPTHELVMLTKLKPRIKPRCRTVTHLNARPKEEKSEKDRFMTASWPWARRISSSPSAVSFDDPGWISVTSSTRSSETSRHSVPGLTLAILNDGFQAVRSVRESEFVAGVKYAVSNDLLECNAMALTILWIALACYTGSNGGLYNAGFGDWLAALISAGRG